MGDVCTRGPPACSQEVPISLPAAAREHAFYCDSFEWGAPVWARGQVLPGTGCTSQIPSPCLLGRAGCCAATTCEKTGILARVTPSQLQPGDAAGFGADGRAGNCCWGTSQGSSNPVPWPGLSQAVPAGSHTNPMLLFVPSHTAFRSRITQGWADLLTQGMPLLSN